MLSAQARDGLARLSDKQREVLDHLILFKSDKEIARDLGVSIKTVEQRMAAVRHKLGTGDRNETARIYDALLQDGGSPLYRKPPLAAPPPFADEGPGSAAAATLTLHDAGFGIAGTGLVRRGFFRRCSTVVRRPPSGSPRSPPVRSRC